MCSRTWGAPIFREPACMLCGQTDADPDICGSKQLDFGMCAHAFCMAFSNGLFQQATIVGRTAEVSPEDVQRVVREAERKRRAVNTVSISPCAREGDCVTQYFGEYSSFCQKHSPKQAAEVAPAQDTNCIICMEPVGDKKSYHTLVCPACKHAWFHRACIQGQAIRAGVNCFQCPLCRDADAFLSDMLVMGIRIPLSGPMWEDGNAYASLGLRHGRCDASECLSPQGRGQAEEEGPWELLLCSSCAAEGTHRRCSYLSNNADAWECKACAGMGTGKRQIARWGPGKAWQRVHGAAWPTSLWPRADCSLGWRPVLLTTLLPLTASSVISEVTGPSTASQLGLLPSHGSTAPESGSSSTASPAPSGPVHSSQVPESGSLSSQLGTGHGDDDIYNHPHVAVGAAELRLHRVLLIDAPQHLPVKGHRCPQGLPWQLAAAGPDRESGLGHEAALQYNLRPRIPTAIPKGAPGGAVHQLQG
ncbi:PHD finger protein 7-like [Gallus gallus]|uniref:PHD finger protein 7-like n=1 Tax=Gallus gallus TaxID=9031 RepID=UPI001AE5776D|nr:PHD finger protein 7-like [Gallus gallus]